MKIAQPPAKDPASKTPETKVFNDPPEDDNPQINAGLGVFYRLSLTGHKLSDLVAIVPELPDLAVAMQNTSTGCWAAFTSTRISERITAQIYLPHVMEIVDQNGRRLCFKNRSR